MSYFLFNDCKILLVNIKITHIVFKEEEEEEEEEEREIILRFSDN